MVNKDRWQYDSTFTVRIEKATKDRLRQAAVAKGIPLSEHIRNILETGKLPEDFITHLSEENRAKLEKWARQNDKKVEDIVAGLLPIGLSEFLDKQPGY